MSWLAVGLLVAGLLLLLAGGELMVRGAAAMAARWGVSPLMIGMTVVAFGTSAPEFAVSLGSAFTGRVEIALGNVVGSNIFNVLVILGAAAVVSPLAVSRPVIRREVPIMVGASLLGWVLTLDGLVSRVDGIVLFAGLLLYTGFAIRQGRREGAAPDTDDASAGPRRLWVQAALLLGGLALLALGAQWFVDGAGSIARALGVSELIIALTVVAAGTSLPELATSVVASVRGQREIAVGNVVGSNLFNVLGVLGLTAAVAPGGVAVAPEAAAFDLPVMAMVAVVCLPVFLTGHRVSRGEGVWFLAYYAGYLVYLVLRATNPAAQDLFHWLLLWVMLPGTLLLIFYSVAMHLRVVGLGRS